MFEMSIGIKPKRENGGSPICWQAALADGLGQTAFPLTMALLGHVSTQFPQPVHNFMSNSGRPVADMVSACSSQALSQIPHPEQYSDISLGIMNLSCSGIFFSSKT